MRAILISAGRGTRLLPLTKNTPKCLIHVGNGDTILENQIKTLRESGIEDISIITGYLTEQIEAKVKDIKGIEIIYNPFYDEANNLYSLWMAKWRMDEEIITINGDNIFYPEVIEELMEREEDIVMAISKEDEYDDDDMKVSLKGDRVVKVGKNLELQEVDGESVGIIKFTKKGAQILKDQLEEMVKSGKHREDFYLAAIQKIIDKNITVNYHEIDSGKWQEMDFHQDVDLIRNLLESKYDLFKNYKSK